jgi:hypothetical protein
MLLYSFPVANRSLILAMLLLLPAASAQPAEIIDTIPVTYSVFVSGQLSSDGTRVVWIEEGSGDPTKPLRSGLRILNLRSRVSHAICNLGPNPNWQADIAPGGDFLYFTKYEVPDKASSLYRVAVVGGEPKRVSSGISGFWLSPDGKQLRFTRKNIG